MSRETPAVAVVMTYGDAVAFVDAEGELDFAGPADDVAVLQQALADDGATFED